MQTKTNIRIPERRENVNLKSAALLLCLLLLVPAVHAIDVRQIYITIDKAGDATATLNYNENPVEYLGIKTLFATVPGVQDQLGKIAHRDVRVVCADNGVASLEIGSFASVAGTTYSTPEIDLSSAKSSNPLPVSLPVNFRSDVTIVFPDGYSVQQKNTEVIHPVTHTLGSPQQAAAPPAQQCRQKKDLPLSGIIPDELEPVAAVSAGVALTALGLTIFGSLFNTLFANLVSFIQNTIGSLISGTIASKKKEKLSISQDYGKREIAGFSARELGVLAAGAIIIGVLFFYAARMAFDPVLILVYIVMGGIALMAHELAHWYLTKKYQCRAEMQFWGLGTVIMAITAYLFGNVFGQPTLTVVRHDQPMEKRSLGLIMLSGPVLSFLIALACLLLIPLGGIFRVAGIIGFSINILTSVFELLPISPCDGREVRSWDWRVWAVVFIPLMIIFLVVSI